MGPYPAGTDAPRDGCGDSGRHPRRRQDVLVGSPVPGRCLGYVLIAAGVALGAWAQAVNRFFEPGVRLQRERGQFVITSGPYQFVRHPGYVSAIMIFVGVAFSLASWWALIPAAFASAILILRTSWEDELLCAELDGYADYARHTRFRLAPGIW